MCRHRCIEILLALHGGAATINPFIDGKLQCHWGQAFLVKQTGKPSSEKNCLRWPMKTLS